jgi:hypothetical protein
MTRTVRIAFIAATRGLDLSVRAHAIGMTAYVVGLMIMIGALARAAPTIARAPDTSK